MVKLVEKVADLPKPLRKPLWRFWHKTMNRYDEKNNAKFLNYGYEKLNGDDRLVLQDIDESDRYCIQLYDHVVNKVDHNSKSILEVGCGRGGGASYISRYYKPGSYTGLDITQSSIDFCNQHYKDIEGLSFKCGVAEDLPIEDKSYDYVVNVESARVYDDIQAFFNEVYRVLKDDGKLLIADMVYPHEMENFRGMMEKAGFKIEHEEEITKNVVAALGKDSDRREKLIKEMAPWIFRNSARTFAGTKGSSRYKNFENGRFTYWSFILTKQV